MITSFTFKLPDTMIRPMNSRELLSVANFVIAFCNVERREYTSVGKVVSQSKLTEQIFMQQAKQNCQIVHKLFSFPNGRTNHVTPGHLPMFSTVRTVFYALRAVRAGRKSCLPAPVPVLMVFRLNLTD